MCFAFTTLLLEEPSTGKVHLFQIKFKRTRSFNDDFFTSEYTGSNKAEYTELDCETFFKTSPADETFLNGKTYY